MYSGTSTILSDQPITAVKGVGPARAILLSRLGIESVGDALQYYPKKHIDRRRTAEIAELIPEQTFTIVAHVKSINLHRRGRRSVLRATAFDETGSIQAVWFNQAYFKDKLTKEELIVFTGKIRSAPGDKLQMHNPDFEIIGDGDQFPNFAGRIVPVYGLTEGLSQKIIRGMIRWILETCQDGIDDPLPEYFRQKLGLLDLAEAWGQIHFPDDEELLERAVYRLKLQELFLLQMGITLRRKSIRIKQKKQSYKKTSPIAGKFLNQLPFELTAAQRRSISEIESDIQAACPMNRLLQGDVGSGKTVVAVWAMLRAVENGCQAAIMAPTEVLARQHYNKIQDMLEIAEVEPVLLTGAIPAAERRALNDKILTGAARVIVGTHALFQKRMAFKNLGLIVVDEQHRFGVMQRLNLFRKGHNPDVLVMTATPIPRTLAITVYGDMDFSVIDEMPKNRLPIRTTCLKESQIEKAFDFIRKQVQAGRQAYIIYPLIEESENLNLKAAKVMFEKLKKDSLSGLKLGLIHGALASERKEKVMRQFKNGRIDVLVSTTVIEVGIDVSNATVMMIENAERFGLAQLHQLRGRVGRGEAQSYCILIGNPKTAEAKKRLKTMLKTTDGFKIAEADLKIRGTGEFFGTRQSGIPELRIADPMRDKDLMNLARAEAKALIDDPGRISDRERRLLRRELKKLYHTSFSFITA